MDKNLREYKKELKDFIKNNPGSTAEEFSDYKRNQEIEYSYNKELDPNNTDWQSEDSFYNNPIFMDKGGETTTSIDSKNSIVQSSKNGSMAQTDLETQDFYSPKQIDWLQNNATTLGLSEKDIQKIEQSGSGKTSIYQESSNDGPEIISIDEPTHRAGNINVNDKNWSHMEPLELKSSFEEANAKVMNNPNLSSANKKDKLDAMKSDYIEKWRSGENKVTSGRQIFEEEFQPAANKAIADARLQFEDTKNSIINNPSKTRKKFTLGKNN